MPKTFTAHAEDGSILYTGRGKAGAAQKAIDALFSYRREVAAASGYLYGNPGGLGCLKVNGSEAGSCAGYYDAEDMAR